MNVFVLFGNTGEYSDHIEWVVRAYTSKEDADADCAALNEMSKPGKFHGGFAMDQWADYLARETAAIERLTQHDANRMGYGVPDYYVAKVALAESRQVPEEVVP